MADAAKATRKGHKSALTRVTNTINVYIAEEDEEAVVDGLQQNMSMWQQRRTFSVQWPSLESYVFQGADSEYSNPERLYSSFRLFWIRCKFNTESMYVPSSNSCKMKSACSCYLEHQGIVDLSFLSGPNQGPTFSTSSNVTYYEWNPCSNFTDRNSQDVCKDTKLCKQDKQNNTFTNLGSAAEFFYNATKQAVVMIYQAAEYHTEIALVCSESTTLDKANQLNKTHLYLTLFSQCACPGHCVKRLSPGSILCILFFSLLMSYFTVGALYRKTVHQSEGWDMIPQREFWRELPSLIRDGYMFFISPCLGNRVQYTMYQHVPGHNFEDIEETGEDDDDDEEYEER